MKIAAAVFVAVMLSAVLLSQGPVVARLWELRQSARSTSGVVVKVDPLDHNRATYSYTVNDSQYLGSEVGSFRRSGERVVVYYAAADPSSSILDEPRHAFHDAALGMGLVCAFFVGAAVFGILRSS